MTTIRYRCPECGQVNEVVFRSRQLTPKMHTCGCGLMCRVFPGGRVEARPSGLFPHAAISQGEDK
jgi:predicted nucleic acid-binding Zn ribbon protein